MAAPQHILFPYDFSARGHQVVPFVRAIAARSGARVTLLSSVPPTFEAAPAGIAPVRASDDPVASKESLTQRLQGTLATDFAGLTVDCVAESGHASLRIVEFAHAHDVDLIMMPTHGVGAFRGLLVGSVTSEVLHAARVPVWTAAHADTQTAQPDPRTVLCAVDGSPATGSIARWATDFARGTSARLALVHVVAPVSDWPSLESERRLQEHLRETAREALTATLRAAGVDAPIRIAVGPIAQTVAEEASQEQADLIVIGRGVVAEPFGRLRTHALGIIQGAPCPVVSV